MRALYVLGIVVALVIIADGLVNDPGPGRWGWWFWGLAKGGKLLLAAMMLHFGIRRLRNPKDSTSLGSA